VKRLAVVLAAMAIASCAPKPRFPKPAPPQLPPSTPQPPAPVSMPAPPAPVSVPAPPASPAPLTGAIDCPVRREWRPRLLDTTGPFLAQWRACRAPDALHVGQQQIAVWQPGVSALAWGLENEAADGGRLLVDRVDTLDLDADRQEELLIVMRHEGTGAYLEWCLLGRKGRGIGCWDSPDLEAPAAKLLAADEDFGFHGWQLRELRDGLRLERSVYHKGVDPNCCPTRGSVVVTLAARNGALAIASITRTAAKPAAPPGTRR
jgi:hypothetical protein